MKTAKLLAALALLGVAGATPATEAPAGALADQPQWLRLLHYRPDGGSASGWRSSVTSPEFFLAGDGATQPRHELAATLAALAAPVNGEPDRHAQCRFPARDLWLRRALGEQASWPRVACPAFRAWSGDESTQAISLVFATGYLANPASYYGHILLKFNAPRSTRVSDLLDVSVNYGALVPDGAGMIPYMLKGVFGGYDGGFSHTGYYFHRHNYGENEHRDLWEYELELPRDDVRLLTAHAWEMVGRKFQYFFLSENCAYRIAELLEILDGVDVMPDRPWTIPQSVIRNVAHARRDGRPLLRDVRYRPSRQSRFHSRYLQLDGPGRRAVAQAVAATDYLTTSAFQALPATTRADVLDTLVDYFEFREGGPKAATDRSTSPGAAAALAARFALPGRSEALPAAPQSPHLGRKPGLASLGAVENEELGSGVALRWRAAYYDPLDADAAHIAHSALGMADVRVALYDGTARLERLDFVSVESANPAVSRLPGDDGRTWSLTGGLAQQYAGCPDDCLIVRIDGGLGRALRLGPLLAGAQLGGAVHNDRNGEGVVSGRGDVVAHLSLGPTVRASLRYRHRLEVDGDIHEPQSVEAQARVQLRPGSDIRLEYGHDGTHQGRLSFGWYW